MGNAGFRKSLQLMQHPIIITSIFILALNDHILRKYWPSIITGKMGDFAWLFFFPVCLAALLSLVGPTKTRHDPLPAALWLTGTVFFLSNTLTPFRHLMESLISLVIGTQVSITQDPSDLIALLSFLPLWMIWKKVKVEKKAIRHPIPYLLIIMGVTLSLANSAAANYGVDCLSAEGTMLYAYASAGDEVFVSLDGGETWISCPECEKTCRSSMDVVFHPENPEIQYRFGAGEFIERSLNGGNSWSLAYRFSELHDAQTALYRHRTFSTNINDGPFHGLIDAASSNAIFAMGHDGVLVYQLEVDEWLWVQVGRYNRIQTLSPTSLGEVIDFLNGEFLTAILLGSLTVAMLLISEPRKKTKIVILLIPWVVIIFSLASSPALGQGGYISFPAYLFVVPFVLMVLIHVIAFSREQIIQWQIRGLLAAFLLPATFLFVPYIFWSYAWIPRYELARAISLVAAIVIILFIYKIKHRLLRGN